MQAVVILGMPKPFATSVGFQDEKLLFSYVQFIKGEYAGLEWEKHQIS